MEQKNENILRRSERLIKKQDIRQITDKNMNKETSKSPSIRSAHSTIHSHSSVASLKRLAEARAARELAELDKQKVERMQQLEEQRLSAEYALIKAKLAEETAMLDEAVTDNDNHDASTTRSEIQKWVDSNVPCSNVVIKDKVPCKEDCCHVTRTQSDDIATLTRAITDAIKKTSDRTHHAPSGDKMLSRLSARDLPIFSGNPVDWLRFKHVFEMTTRVGQYTDEENVARLQRCLQGEAWEAVAARLVTSTSASEIMKTLELRFGRPELVLNKLITQIKRMPRLNGSRTELVILSTKVSNCVAAIKAIDINYLFNRDLVLEIVNKLTENLVYRWTDYCINLDVHHPRLSALADYLTQEAEQACKAGVIEIPPATRFSSIEKRSVLTAVDDTSDTEDNNCFNIVSAQKNKQMQCLFCQMDGHTLDNCSDFSKEEVIKRWSWVCEKGLCFKCLRPKHQRERCRMKKNCKVCKRGHHSLLHRYDWEKNKDKVGDEVTLETTANLCASVTVNKRVFLKVLPVTVVGPTGSIDTYALLDEGSTVSLVDSEIVRQVGADGPSTNLNLQGAVGDMQKLNSRIVSLTLHTTCGVHMLKRVRTIDNFSLPVQNLEKRALSCYTHLNDIPLQAYDGQPKLLIGQDYWQLIVTRELRQGRMNEPVASRTLLGWVLHGFVSSTTKFDISCHLRETDPDQELHQIVKEYFRLDSMGVKHVKQEKLTEEESRALHLLDTKSIKKDGRWEAGLLWRSDDLKLPDNKRNAMKRLMITEKMMDADASFAADYMKQVDTMLERGYAEEVNEAVTGDRTWYLPHFGVRNPNKPGKLRLVFDARAETKGVSLSTELIAGPDLLNSLIGVLFRFRERAVAVTGDIREMFLRIKIIEIDQKSQMFLWRGLDRKDPPRVYKMTSMTFGAKSSPCTATYILRRNADLFKESHPRAVMAIKRRHYVDDYLDSVDSEEEMRKLIADVRMIHASGGFEIRGFVSNKPNCLPDETQTETVNLCSSEVEQRTLGMIWKPKRDALGFDLSLKKNNDNVAKGLKRPTKREILKVVMSIFDPLGFMCPVLIRGKILLQDIWRSGVQWDEEIGEKFANTWFTWLQDLKSCSRFEVPRCYNFTQLDSFQLHTFVDASEQAYAAIAYLRRDNGEVAFVAAKSQVAPLKAATIPRLELQSALMGARLASMIVKEIDLKIGRRFFWTDSRAVWHWIQNNPHKGNSFLHNRLSEINDLTRTQEWRWLPGIQNVADEATRSSHRSNSKWISGPEFLRKEKIYWPRITPLPLTEIDENTHNIFVTNSDTDYKMLPDINRFSKWLRLIRSTAYVQIFLKRLKLKSPISLDNTLLDQAEELWIKKCQRDSFSDDIFKLMANAPLSKGSHLRTLNPYLHNGILRLKGRASLTRNVERYTLDPMIIDGRHSYTKLLIQHLHEKMYHGSTETVVNELRQKYWVIHLRPTVRRVEHNCQFCKIRKAQPLQPCTGDLPLARLDHHSRPFTHCGLDYFGPMTVTIGRRHEKRYGALFTCMTTRAIHIELAGSLTTDSTIMAMRRMMCRRGSPLVMYSDNGTNFRGADIELRRVFNNINQVGIATFLTNKRIEWRFNPPLAPHMGGCWERLVRTVKTSLKIVLKEQAPKEETLITLLTEIEHTVNSRPLTHVSVSSDDPEALTPNHFLLGSSSGVPWLGDCDSVSRKCWRNAQRLADMFWKRWLREFLPTLLPRGSKGRNTILKKGSIVVIVDPALPRNVWPKGVVESLYPGRDGVPRVADVRTGGGILKRPLTRLVPLLC